MTSGRFPPTPLYKYPRMRPEDVAVWVKFISAYGKQFSGFDYDYPLGTGRNNPYPPYSDRYRLYEGLTRYRADAIGYRPTSIWVIEIKETATPEAIGQALSYAEIMRRDPPDSRPIVPVVVSGDCRPEMRDVFRTNGVELFCVDLMSENETTSDISGA